MRPGSPTTTPGSGSSPEREPASGAPAWHAARQRAHFHGPVDARPRGCTGGAGPALGARGRADGCRRGAGRPLPRQVAGLPGRGQGGDRRRGHAAHRGRDPGRDGRILSLPGALSRRVRRLPRIPGEAPSALAHLVSWYRSPSHLSTRTLVALLVGSEGQRRLSGEHRLLTLIAAGPGKRQEATAPGVRELLAHHLHLQPDRVANQAWRTEAHDV